MDLDRLPCYPQARSYVLNLHRDAAPGQGLLRGRVTHIGNGDTAEFATGAELLAWLAQHATQLSDCSCREARP